MAAVGPVANSSSSSNGNVAPATPTSIIKDNHFASSSSSQKTSSPLEQQQSSDPLSSSFPFSSLSSQLQQQQQQQRPETHTFVVSGTTFTIDLKYKLIKPIGHGAYGVVISAENTETGEKVAIKKISKAFDDLVDAKRILREIKLLQHFDHENIITLVDLLPPATTTTTTTTTSSTFDQFEDVYIISDLMETDLHRIIYSRQPLTDDHIQYFLYQILRALKYIHSANVLHRDLKPSNLLLNSNCDLKICDFGLARGIEPEEDNLELTEYVVTRWYRAPEIMLSTKEYTKAIDMWSTGCIFAELLGRKPLFPGDDYIHQLRIICDKIGTPEEEDLNFVTSEKAKRFMKNQPIRSGVPFQKLFPQAKPAAIDLLEKMLVFDPSKRISVEEALAHPYLESLHDIEDESIADKCFSFDFEKQDLTKKKLQELILEEICHFHPEAMSYTTMGTSSSTTSTSTIKKTGITTTTTTTTTTISGGEVTGGGIVVTGQRRASMNTTAIIEPTKQTQVLSPSPSKSSTTLSSSSSSSSSSSTAPEEDQIKANGC